MNWEPIIIAVLAAVPPTLVALAAFLQATKAAGKAIETHIAVNSRMDEMLKLVRLEATAKATLDEKSAQGLREVAATEAVAAEHTRGL